MKILNEDLKNGQIRQVYLLYGEEEYLKKQYKERFTRTVCPDGDTVNYAYYEGKNIDIREVIDLAQTMPFFADRRLIVLENTGFFKNAAELLADYIKELPATCVLLFVEQEVDKRSKMYKAVKAKGYAAELSLQDAAVLKRWIIKLVRAEKKQIFEQDILYFLDKVGTNMENISKELEKVFCYTLERERITKEDIDAVCVTQISGHIFEMVDAVSLKQQKKALSLYYELLELKEPPMRILYLMSRQYRILYQVKDMLANGSGKNEIASSVGIPPFAAGKYMKQAGQFKVKELRQIMEDSVEIEHRVKTGLLTDTLAVELFLVKYSSAAQAE